MFAVVSLHLQDWRDNGGFVWRYLIYDCISVDGDDGIQKQNLLRRLQAAKKFVTEPLERLREVQQRQAAELQDASRDQQHSYQGGAFLDETFAFGRIKTGPSAPPMEIYLKAS